MKRVHVTESFGQAERLTLSSETSHHLLTVLRMKPSDELRLFNDRGEWAEAVILGIENDRVLVRIARRLDGPGTPAMEIILCPAVMKGSRMDWVVEKASEIGVTSIKPILTERTIVKDPGTNKVARWKRLAVAAAEQSGRGAPLVVEGPSSFESVLSQVAGDSLVLLFHTEGENIPLSQIITSGIQRISVLTGPEGGFSLDEIGSARSRGAKVIKLDMPVLRADTAAFVGALAPLLLVNSF